MDEHVHRLAPAIALGFFFWRTFAGICALHDCAQSCSLDEMPQSKSHLLHLWEPAESLLHKMNHQLFTFIAHCELGSGSGFISVLLSQQQRLNLNLTQFLFVTLPISSPHFCHHDFILFYVILTALTA